MAARIQRSPRRRRGEPEPAPEVTTVALDSSALLDASDLAVDHTDSALGT